MANEMSNEEFEMLWELNANGNKEAIFYTVKDLLSRKAILPSGKEINFQVLYSLYKNYIEFLEDKQNGKFTKADYNILPIDQYIQQGKYRISYQGPKRTRDLYLFGETKDIELGRKLTQFIAQYERPENKTK